MLNPLVLVADDDKDFLELIGAKLKAKGLNYQTVKDGVETVSKARELNPALILMDVDMPKKDGIEATFDLQDDPTTKNIKIIYLTNLGDPSPSVAEINRRFSKEIGAIDYFKKGGDWEILMTKIHDILETNR